MQGFLVVNVGSSTLKFSVFDASLLTRPICLYTKNLQRQQNDVSADVDCMMNLIKEKAGAVQIIAAGHRVVHGGEHYTQPTPLSPEVFEALKKLIPLAPLHQPHSLAVMEILAHRLKKIPHILCFDTAFHTAQPWYEKMFAIPRTYYNEGVMRYGFHGLSYEYMLHKIQQDPILRQKNKIIIAHLGNGSSLCAIQNGISIASTMGFSALDGLIMGTRCGNIDPGVLLYLLKEKKLSSDRIETLLYKESGLKAVSELSSDMRILSESHSPKAEEAITLFSYRIIKEIGALSAALNGLDLLVFTAGIGEHSSLVREKVCAQLGWLGIQLNKNENQKSHGPGIAMLSEKHSTVQICSIPTHEEEMIARHISAAIQKIHDKPAYTPKYKGGKRP